MTEEEKKASAEAAVAAAISEGKSQEEADAIGAEILKGTTTDSVQAELDRVNKGKWSKKEKIIHRKKILEKELADLGGEDEDEDIEDEDEDIFAGADDNKPVTVGDMKRIQRAGATKTALQLADEIENESERELAKYHIKNTIRSTGNPREDLRLALVHVNAVRNNRVTEEIMRKGEAKNHSSNSGGGGNKHTTAELELTAEELPYTRPPFNMTKAAILAARPKA